MGSGSGSEGHPSCAWWGPPLGAEEDAHCPVAAGSGASQGSGRMLAPCDQRPEGGGNLRQLPAWQTDRHLVDELEALSGRPLGFLRPHNMMCDVRDSRQKGGCQVPLSAVAYFPAQR